MLPVPDIEQFLTGRERWDIREWDWNDMHTKEKKQIASLGSAWQMLRAVKWSHLREMVWEGMWGVQIEHVYTCMIHKSRQTTESIWYAQNKANLKKNKNKYIGSIWR